MDNIRILIAIRNEENLICLINILRRRLRDLFLMDYSWKGSLIKELLYVREGALFTHLNFDEINFIIDSLCLH